MSQSSEAVVNIDLQGKLKHLASGKVREVYEIDANSLLFVASDRISAYDVILTNGIPNKGAILTQLSAFWFGYLNTQLPSLKTHFISGLLPDAVRESLSPELVAQLEPRSMQVRRLKIFPIESIVRGYITGSAWAEYKTKGTVHGISMPEGLVESAKLSQPIWTPSTKAEQGEHDENISPEAASKLIGANYAKRIEELSLQIYSLAASHCAAHGIILADSKFEFGLDIETDEIVLCDEVLTPDSSRFWPAEGYAVGKGQPSFDKQYLRDWLVQEGLKGKDGVTIPDEIAKGTSARYQEVWKRLVENMD